MENAIFYAQNYRNTEITVKNIKTKQKTNKTRLPIR